MSIASNPETMIQYCVGHLEFLLSWLIVYKKNFIDALFMSNQVLIIVMNQDFFLAISLKNKVE